jgi:hypothetical protein
VRKVGVDRLEERWAESLVSPNENLGNCKVDEIGAKSGQIMMKIGAFLGRKQARLCFILVFIKQIYVLRFFCNFLKSIYLANLYAPFFLQFSPIFGAAKDSGEEREKIMP